jgi:hypothetical protein
MTLGRRCGISCAQVVEGVDASVPLKANTVPPAPSAAQLPPQGSSPAPRGVAGNSTANAAGSHGPASGARLLWPLAGVLVLMLARLQA